MLRSLGGRLCLGVAAAALAAPVIAQSFQVPPNFGSGGVYREDPASALARYLRMVTASPRNLEALTGAGRAALDVGDPQAAIGFYARAEAISPRNGRIKAGLGSALVLLNQEQAALRYFEEAINFGVPEADIASDRGLAFDLRGSAKRAQRDYALALKRGPDAETTRRMALSLGISGERDAALALLDPLLRRQDTAAWRARAFVLAMTGDTAAASKTAESVMSPTLAAGFAPFFRKLPALRPGQKAAAVHFGNFPGEGRPMRIDDLFNQAEVAARVALENTPRSALDAGTVDGTQIALGRAPARAPDAEGQVSAIQAPPPSAPRVAPVSTPRPNAVFGPTASTSPINVAPPVANPIRIAANTAAQAALAPPVPAPIVSAPVATAPVATTPIVASPTPVASPPSAAAAVVTSSAVPASRPANEPTASAATPSPGFGTVVSQNVPAAPPEGSSRLADISATVREVARPPVVSNTELPPSQAAPSILPPVLSTPSADAPSVGGSASATPPVSAPADGPTRAEQLASLGSVLPASPPAAAGPRVETPVATTPSAAGPRVETAVASAPPAAGPRVETSASPAEIAAAPAGEDSRVWVQIAGGADEKSFPAEWRRLRGKAPDLLTERTAWTTPLRATNRLLVGPFESASAAQDFVNKLAPKGITAFAWTSARGQAITKLATR